MRVGTFGCTSLGTFRCTPTTTAARVTAREQFHLPSLWPRAEQRAAGCSGRSATWAHGYRCILRLLVVQRDVPLWPAATRGASRRGGRGRPEPALLPPAIGEPAAPPPTVGAAPSVEGAHRGWHALLPSTISSEGAWWEATATSRIGHRAVPVVLAVLLPRWFDALVDTPVVDPLTTEPPELARAVRVRRS